MIGLLDEWLRWVGTYKGLRRCLVDYAQGRGLLMMEELTWGSNRRLQAFSRSQDQIGWRCFMEGMISKEVLAVQAVHVALGNCQLSLEGWAQGLVIKLLEATHRASGYTAICICMIRSMARSRQRRRRTFVGRLSSDQIFA